MHVNRTKYYRNRRGTGHACDIARIFFGLVLAGVISVGCAKKSASRGDRPKPRLVIFVSLDQFRHDYLDRFERYLTAGGLRYLVDHGASFSDCRYTHATAHTAVGHSIMASGTLPNKSGIVANEWYDAKRKQLVYAVMDSTAPILWNPPQTKITGRSPRNFIGATIGDVLRMHTGNQAKVFSVSNKDRSAILMGGHLANAVYWIDDDVGSFVTSTYYMDAYPDWVVAYRQEKPLTRWMGAEWNLSLPSENYPQIADSARSHFDVRYGMGAGFPHMIGSVNRSPDKDYFHALRSSPFGAEAILDFAKRLVVEEELGRDEVPDILNLSISVTDRVGHEYGPHSAELMDAVIKVDWYLSDFFQFVDETIGSSSVLYVLTSDHGGPPIPEHLRASGIASGRLDVGLVTRFIETTMQSRYGRTGPGQSYVLNITDPNIYLNETLLSEKNIDIKAAERYIADALKAEFSEIYRVYPAEEIADGRYHNDAISDQVVRSFYHGRSGHLVVVLRPYFIWDWNGRGTDHGQPYSYDVHVPLILTGADWIQPGRYGEACSPADIAPTLSEILRIEFPPGIDGRILSKAVTGVR